MTWRLTVSGKSGALALPTSWQETPTFHHCIVLADLVSHRMPDYSTFDTNQPRLGYDTSTENLIL